MPTVEISCPFCSKLLRGGFTAGGRVQCPRCKKAFTLRLEDLRAAAVAAAPAPAVRPRPTAPPVPSGPAPAAALPPWAIPLGVVAVAVLLLIGAGVALALHFAAKPPPQQAAAATVPTPPAVEPTDPPRDDPDLHRKPLKDDPPPPVHLPKPPPALPPPLTPGPDPTPAPQPSGLSPEQDAKVQKAIDRGVAFLESMQQDDGSWQYGENAVGATSLPGLTLLQCGVSADDPHVKKAAAFVRENSAGLGETYELALAILFLDRLGDPKDDPLIRTLALRIIAGQSPAGGWTYNCPVLGADARTLQAALRKTRPTTALELVVRHPADAPAPAPKPNDDGKALEALSPEQRELPALRLVPADDDFPPDDSTDNSCTQFAILGLWTARRHDVPTERALAWVNKRFRVSQNDDGGWGYNFSRPPNGDQSPSMTAAGLLGLAVGHGVTADLQGDDPAKSGGDAAVEKGMKALSESIGVALGDKKGDTVQPPQDLYFLWSVERVGVLYNRRTIADKEWYPWGAEVLLDNQQPDGSWSNAYGGEIDTSFALLFLKRANLASDLSTKLQFLTQIKK